jgi:phosphoribosylformylglycinamidine cyclo-ligase
MEYRVNIDLANTTKAELASIIDGKDKRILNRVGAFSSLFLPDLTRYSEPVLVFKTEEPGSKQVLAFQYGRIEPVCYDVINHLINDCVVMGAEPLGVQDLVVCGRLDKSVITRVVTAVSAACLAQGCALTGGETTEQPDILPDGTYILGSSIVGIVERSRIIDGSSIQPGDVVIALGSSGPHTNGYTLIRDLLNKDPSLAEKPVESRTFIEAVLEPHRCYYQSVKGLFDGRFVGLAHITGGGIRENLNRILPPTVNARINLALYRPSAVFQTIQNASNASSELMLRTFNLGVGLAVVCRPDSVESVIEHLSAFGEQVYVIGETVSGSGKVGCYGTVPQKVT